MECFIATKYFYVCLSCRIVSVSVQSRVRPYHKEFLDSRQLTINNFEAWASNTQTESMCVTHCHRIVLFNSLNNGAQGIFAFLCSNGSVRAANKWRFIHFLWCLAKKKELLLWIWPFVFLPFFVCFRFKLFAFLLLHWAFLTCLLAASARLTLGFHWTFVPFGRLCV